MKRLVAGALIVAVAVLILAITGAGSTAHKAAQTAVPAGGGGIEARSTPLGRILVDTRGRTLYLFEADKPNVSNCSGACLSLWPPLTAGKKPQATAGALSARIGTIPTSSGKRQVTYQGHPLYLYAGDQKPGDTTGQGLDQFGAAWYVLAPDGNKVDNG
jgi:predicted lipoprotein with Yx(FWY)xxD motif